MLSLTEATLRKRRRPERSWEGEGRQVFLLGFWLQISDDPENGQSSAWRGRVGDGQRRFRKNNETVSWETGMSPPSYYSPLFTTEWLIFHLRGLLCALALPLQSLGPAHLLPFLRLPLGNSNQIILSWQCQKEMLLTGLKKAKKNGSAVPMQVWIIEAFATYMHNHFFTGTLQRILHGAGHFVTLWVCGAMCKSNVLDFPAHKCLSLNPRIHFQLPLLLTPVVCLWMS